MSEILCAPVNPPNNAVAPSEVSTSHDKNDGNGPSRSDSSSSVMSLDDPSPDARLTPYFRALSKIFPRRNAPRATRVACRARGLAEDHDAARAYIEVPANAWHGELLMCSHPLCAESGRRFRYCSVCDGPVSKRNFNARHSHGRLAQTSSESFDYVYAPKEQVEANGGRASFPAKRQRLNKSGKSTRFSPTTVPKKTSNSKNTSSEANNTPSLPNSQSLPELSAALRTAGLDSVSLDSSQLTVEERQWLQLFRSRPMSGSIGPEAQEWIGSVVGYANQAIGRRAGHERELSALDTFTNMTPEELDSLLDLQDLQMGDLTTL